MNNIFIIFRNNKSILIGLVFIIIVAFAAIFAPYISTHNLYEMDITKRLEPPSREHLLGTDQYGRDLFTRIIYGSRISLQVGLVSVGISMIWGVILGLIAGFYGGWIDTIIMRLVDIFLSFPLILLAIALVAALGPSIINVMLALGIVYWTQYARVVRSSVLEIKEEDYIEAARALGASNFQLIYKHILPNILAPIIVIATLGLGTAIVAEATLSFLGLGVQPPNPSWGGILHFGLRFIRDAPTLSIFPGFAIMITVLGFNILGNGLRDLSDPKLNR